MDSTILATPEVVQNRHALRRASAPRFYLDNKHIMENTKVKGLFSSNSSHNLLSKDSPFHKRKMSSKTDRSVEIEMLMARIHFSEVLDDSSGGDQSSDSSINSSSSFRNLNMPDQPKANLNTYNSSLPPSPIIASAKEIRSLINLNRALPAASSPGSSRAQLENSSTMSSPTVMIRKVSLTSISSRLSGGMSNRRSRNLDQPEKNQAVVSRSFNLGSASSRVLGQERRASTSTLKKSLDSTSSPTITVMSDNMSTVAPPSMRRASSLASYFSLKLRDSQNISPNKVPSMSANRCRSKMNSYAVIAVMGASGVGKSAMAQRIINGLFIEEYNVTAEEHLSKTIEVDKSFVNLQLVDVGGHLIGGDSQQSQHYYRSADAFAVVYSVLDKESLEFADRLMESIAETRDRAPMMLFGTKVDLPERTVDPRDARRVAEKHGVAHVEVSATNPRISTPFLRLLRQSLYTQIDESSPPSRDFRSVPPSPTNEAAQKPTDKATKKKNRLSFLF